MVDDGAAVLDRVVGEDARDAAAGIDLDQGEVGAARVDLARVDGPGDVEPGSEVSFGDLAKCLDETGQATHCAAADEGSAARRTRVRVALYHVDQRGVDAQLAFRHQPERLRVPLSRLRSAGEDLDPSSGGDPDPGRVITRNCGDTAPPVLGGAGAAVLVEEPDPDPDQPALRSRRGLPAAELGVAGALLEPLEQPQVIARVEVAAGGSAGRELGHRVAPPELERVQAEPSGDDVNQPLSRVCAGVHAHPAIGAGRALAADDGAGQVAGRAQGVGSE